MGFQSGINAMLGTVAGGALAISKTLQDRQQEANKKVEQQRLAKKAQRRNFMSYLRKQPTDLGGTVGDLPINLQKQIASQFSKNARKKLMDKMDMEIKK